MENQTIMTFLFFLEKTVRNMLENFMLCEIWISNKMKFGNRPIFIRGFYFLASILIGSIIYYFILETNYFIVKGILGLLGISMIVVVLFLHQKISTDHKMDFYKFIRVPMVRRKRKRISINFNFKFDKTLVLLIYNKLLANEYLKKTKTSFGSFDYVLRKNFGHDHKIHLEMNLAQIRCLFEVFEKQSKGFASIAIRRELFLKENSTKIIYGPYRNTKSSRNKRAMDVDFQYFIADIDNTITSYLERKNDDM